MDVQPHGGKPLPEVPQQAGQYGQGERRGETDPQSAGPAAAGLAGRRQTVREPGEGVPGGREQFPSRRGEDDPPRLAAEQRMADDDFEPCRPVLRRAFGEVRPAATMLVCGLADPRMRIEIEVYARRTATP
ncbi:hypothetical protein AB0F25_10225 [Streptomyces wedmorensis]|uniref:hypothetical protein n=1 Tax=Streptomyces wedmorensis TaxID=43759 RepID=UPI003412C58B